MKNTPNSSGRKKTTAPGSASVKKDKKVGSTPVGRAGRVDGKR